MRSVLRMMVIAASAVAVAWSGAPPAIAGDSVEATATAISEVAPDDEGIVSLSLHDDALSGSASSTLVSVPLDPTDPVELTTSGPGGVGFEVGLPSDLSLASGRAAADGTVVYQSDSSDASAAVQALDDGDVRLQTVLHDESSQQEFTYTFSDQIVLTESAHGAVLVTEEAPGVSITLAEVEPAWAFDANGQEVSTHFEIDGNHLTQVVTPAAGVAYPVVADPRLSFGIGVYYHFNRAETATMSQYGGDATLGIVGGCAALGALAGGVGAPIAAGVCALYAAPFFYNAGIAQNSSPKKCVYLRIVGFTWWTSGTYRDSRCS